jgi:DNA-binding CsgD family transcriptional regulator
MTRLRTAVYESILDVLHEAARAESVRPFPEEVAGALRRALGCDAVAYWEGTEREGLLDMSVDADDRDNRLRVWQRYWEFRNDDPIPTARPPEPALVGVPLALQDRTSLRRFRQTGLYQEICRPYAVRDVLKVYLPHEGERYASIVCDTSRARFTEPDKDVLRRLLPFFIQTRAAARRRGTAATASRKLALLTPRETVVLGRVADGETNRQIAKALFVAPTTVRKHLENIYDKLEVPNRAAAAALYAQSGPAWGPGAENEFVVQVASARRTS